MTRNKFKYFKNLLKDGDWTILDTFFHDDYLYLKDHTLINRDDHIHFMKKEFGKKINVIDPQFLYEDDHMMTYSYNIAANGKNYKVIQVQMYKDEKIWREMSNAVEIKNQVKGLFEGMYIRMVSIKFPSQQKADAFVAMMKTSWLEKLEHETLTVEQTVMKTGEGKIVGFGRYNSEEDFLKTSSELKKMWDDFIKSFDGLVEWHSGEVVMQYKRDINPK